MQRINKIGFFLVITSCFAISGFTLNLSLRDTNLAFYAGIKLDTSENIRQLRIDSLKLSIIPPSSGVQFYKDGIVFLSMTRNEVKMLPEHISFGTIEAYYATLRDSVLEGHNLFSESSVFSYPCDGITFSSDFNLMYYTKFPEHDKKEKIYYAKFTSAGKKDSIWLSDLKPLDFCNGNSIYTHPALSAEGDFLIFASDMEGSLGGMDLYIIRRDGEKWTLPKNMGSSINTSGNEMFPFLDSDNNLYFSSDGLSGFGGYDIFSSKFNGKGWDKPVNLKHPINSENDEVGFCIEKKYGKTALYTRKQINDKNKMQLIRVSIKNEVKGITQVTIPYIINGISQWDHSLPGKILIPDIATSKPETEAKIEVIRPKLPIPHEQIDIVIYRVQILSGISPQKSNEIILNGEIFKTYEYFYLGEYRYTIGEFRTLTSAIQLQKLCRENGFPRAFIAAFKNNTRSLDLKLFK
jgi:hypothetical protein